MKMLGIDVGGSGIKGALVDTRSGRFVGDRLRIPTPQPATPDAIAGVIKDIADHFDYRGPIGCGFPAVIQNGVAKTAANVDAGWIGTDANSLFSEISGRDVRVLNDADAAALAELRFGAAKGARGSVLMLTLGTGIGSALFSDGILVPNTELGHLVIDGIEAEHYASAAVRKKENLDWESWAKRLDRVLQVYETLLWPDLIILGGGVSRKFHKYASFLNPRADLVPAIMENQAGIVGAAMWVRDGTETAL